jgi:hypothetical protein
MEWVRDISVVASLKNLTHWYLKIETPFLFRYPLKYANHCCRKYLYLCFFWYTSLKSHSDLPCLLCAASSQHCTWPKIQESNCIRGLRFPWWGLCDLILELWSLLLDTVISDLQFYIAYTLLIFSGQPLFFESCGVLPIGVLCGNKTMRCLLQGKTPTSTLPRFSWVCCYKY